MQRRLFLEVYEKIYAETTENLEKQIKKTMKSFESLKDRGKMVFDYGHKLYHNRHIKDEFWEDPELTLNQMYQLRLKRFK